MSTDVGSTSLTNGELESLFVNNDKLNQIETHLNRFNPIRVMRMEGMEIRHSAILSWLLNPRESHGLDDKVLKLFLGEALRGNSDLGKPTAMDISLSDLRDVEVRREWQNMDIFLYSETNNWAFVVENKFDNRQHEGQLSGYIDKVHSLFYGKESGLTVRGIFLTLHEEEPHDDRYAPVRYNAISEILPRLIEQEKDKLTAEVSIFLNHYIDILKDALGMSEGQKEMERLARQLYREHRKVLDFVWEHGETTDFEFAVQSIFGEIPAFETPIKVDGDKYHAHVIENDWTSFVPHSWYKVFGKDGCKWDVREDWWIGFPMVVWFKLSTDIDGASGQLRLYAEVGPISNYKFRKELIEAIQKAAQDAGTRRISFQNGALEEGKQYSKFFKQNTMAVRDVQNADQIAAAMKTLLKRFQSEFEIVAKILPQFAKYGTPAE